jgi:hypothetical protein
MIRVLFIRSVVDRDWPFSVFYYGDSHHNHLYAMALIEGKLYDQGIPFHRCRRQMACYQKDCWNSNNCCCNSFYFASVGDWNGATSQFSGE